MADKENNTPAEIDDWLDDFEEADKTGAPTDQAEIDSLISDENSGDKLTAAPATGSPDSVSQDDIDALFGETAVPTPGTVEPEPKQADNNASVSQDDIDALFGESAAAKTVTAEAESPAVADNSIDQQDIDTLFDEDNPPQSTPAAAEPKEAADNISPVKQEDIDALFGGSDEPSSPDYAADDSTSVSQNDPDLVVNYEEEDSPASPMFDMQTDESASVSQNDPDLMVNYEEEDSPASPMFDMQTDESASLSQNDPDLKINYEEEESPASPMFDMQTDDDDLDLDLGGSPLVFEESEEDKGSEKNTTIIGSSPMDSIAADEPVDQSEINSMFGDMSTSNVTETITQKVEDIDQLFEDFTDADNDDDKAFHSEEVDFTELLEDDKADDESFSLGEDDFNLSSDTFTLGKDEDSASGETVDAESLFAEDDATEALPDFLATNTDDDETITFLSEKKRGLVLPIPLFLKNKKVVSMAAMLPLLLLIGGYYIMKPGQQPAIVMPEPGQEAGLEMQGEDNTPPRAFGSGYKMPAGGGELAILLTAEDMENDPLTFKITAAPTHGRISGEPPNITYLPNNNFPGEDRFSFLVSDGHGISEPTDIVISGPNLAGKPKAVTVAAKPKRIGVTAKNITISLRSTESLNLDWRTIWKESNHAPFGKNVHVQILDKKLHGKLAKISSTKHRYQPDPYFNGRESIKYRFKRGKTFSKPGYIKLVMTNGEPPPQVILSPLAKSYHVGELVTLDASASRDENRNTLRFSWQQTSGTPIRFQKMNAEGSIISFVMPSSFYKGTSPGPQILVTAIDDSDQQSQEDIRINSISRQRAALWRGNPNGSTIAIEPSCPQGRCPGDKLPWPYPN